MPSFLPVRFGLCLTVVGLALNAGCGKSKKPTEPAPKNDGGTTVTIGSTTITPGGGNSTNSSGGSSTTATATQAQVDKLRTGMTTAQVEKILGPGRKNGAGKEWNDGGKSLTLIFEDDKITGWVASGFDMSKMEPDKPKPEFLRKNDVTQLGSTIQFQAQKLKIDRVPAKLEDLKFLKETGPKVYAAVEKGELVVLWGAPLNAPVIAYEKSALTEGGFMFKPEAHLAEKVTAAELKAALAKVKK